MGVHPPTPHQHQAGLKFHHGDVRQKVAIATLCTLLVGPKTEVEFLEEIQTEVLRVFLLAIYRHLY